MEYNKKFDGIENYLSEMIKIPTVSDEAYKEQYKIVEYRELLQKIFSDLFKKANITNIGNAMILHLASDCPEKMPILFIGHMDVVPAVDNEKWKHGAFSGEIVDACIWGRGTQDMKGPHCALLSAFDLSIREGKKFKQDIFLYFSCDEETGGKTTEEAVKWFQDRNIRFKAVFDEGGTICENFMGLIEGKAAMIGIAEKGSLIYRFMAKGEGGHAANPPKETALTQIADFIQNVQTSDLFKKELTDGNRLMLKKIAEINPKKKEILSEISQETTDYSKLYFLTTEASGLLGATIAFTKVSGGTAFNVIPKEIELIANVRVSAIQKECEITKILKAMADKFDISCELLDGNDASEETDVYGWAYTSMASAVQNVYPDIPIVPFVLGGGTDSKHFQKLTQEIIRFSPMYASQDQGKGVHGDNEYAYVYALKEAAHCYYVFINENL